MDRAERASYRGSVPLLVKLDSHLCISRSFYKNKSRFVEGSYEKREVKPALVLPNSLEVEEIEIIDQVLTITAVSIQIAPRCPLCGAPAARIHSHYTRQVADLPCGGQCVRLLLHVRKFFCDRTTCARKIFVERLTPFIEPWARDPPLISDCANPWSGDRRGARRPCNRPSEYPDQQNNHPSAHHGAADRTGGARFADRH